MYEILSVILGIASRFLGNGNYLCKVAINIHSNFRSFVVSCVIIEYDAYDATLFLALIAFYLFVCIVCFFFFLM